MAASRVRLPGLGLSLGYAVTSLTAVVLLPLGALVLKAGTMGPGKLMGILGEERVQGAFYITVTTSFLAAIVNVPLGLLVAWVLVRYRFFGRRLLDAIVDLPFALPTAVAGVALAFLYSSRGWVGKGLTALHFRFPWPVWGAGESGHGWLHVNWYDTVGLSPLGVVVALVFVGMPFVIRAIQPVLEEMNPGEEEAAASLGASRPTVFWRIILPELRPALVTGFALAFARGLGEYGSVLFIAGNQPDVPIVPRLIIERLEGWDIAGSTAVAVLLLALSFVMLLAINMGQWWMGRRAQ
jgi:sulfate transport system permease protein